MACLRAPILALILLVSLLSGAAPAGELRLPAVIAQAQADLDGDGRAETLEVVLLKGRQHHDAEPWCGSGDKWEGSFALRARRGDRLLDQRAWGELFFPPGQADEPAFFWKPLELVLADYNGDGRLDFNLGAYGSCNANLYRLFTLGPDGRLSRLPVQEGRALAVSGAGRQNSTKAIRLEGGLLTHSYYDNTLGRLVTARYRWREGRFAPLAPNP
ncbi:MAG: hypothetical protein KJ720_01250 [Proteobacteria bacterium]|nr:hypothetical protein [Pseudomonadota bacterium]MBU1452625.1 hypothetical protein [Pseudomonadota bacterium]MBU2517890.1 hypothetical protein [Pseudomonadota bacterium]